MKRLTLSEELKLIKEAYQTGHYLDHGSSRSVYTFQDGRVLKVASCIRGQYQNRTEIDIYKYASDQHREHLATIYAYGKYVILMEEITTINSDLVESIWEGSTNYNREKERFEKVGWSFDYNDYEVFILKNTDLVYDHLNVMESLLGVTADNYQLGLDENNKIKAYDYGFERNSRDLAVSNDLPYDISEYGEDDFLLYIGGKLIRRSVEEMKKFM